MLKLPYTSQVVVPTCFYIWDKSSYQTTWKYQKVTKLLLIVTVIKIKQEIYISQRRSV